MNIKNRAELLKKFIEICDTEIFPQKQCSVYVINKSFIGGSNTASYNNTEYLKMILHIPLIFLLFALAKIIFLIKRSSDNRLNLILALQAIGSLKIGFEGESYFVKKQKHLLDMDSAKLASIACHEVRHRVQYHYATTPHYQDVKLLEVYTRGRLNFINSLDRKKVEEDDLEFECDAYFIQHEITKRLKDKFPDGSLSITEFQIFVRENKELLIWRNSYL